MLKSSNFFLLISFFLLLVNGSALGFILFHARLGEGFGISLFCCTSLLGALLASIAFETKSTYYSRLFFYSHLVITILPLYYVGISKMLS
ncbi:MULTISPECIES: hypothetical protein [Bacillaceae]|uniref:hypothetical protein n=1 Tax=Bacillaceae TaxID=186817 RepID=UPI000BFBD763|nr:MULTISPECIES: hypothetical protein [Bacillaceae]PGT87837.1 hypothetical protein COD11_06515 [Bacillus sp. AFS040349]UGB32349.1 hypothetical protein LPC09_07945 [Metabacillus sp. B2-18]